MFVWYDLHFIAKLTKMKKVDELLKLFMIFSLSCFVFSGNTHAFGLINQNSTGSHRDFLSFGIHKLAAQKEARFQTLDNGANYENMKPAITQVYTQINKALGSNAITDTMYFHLGYTNLDVFKTAGNSTFDLDGLGAFAGFHFGQPAVLSLGYETGMMKGALTAGQAGAERFDGSYSSYYYQIGFEIGGELTKAYIYFLQKLITFNTSSVELDSINSTYDGGGISIMSSF